MISGRGPGAEGRVLDDDGGISLCLMFHGSFFNPRNLWLCRRQISPAPMAIFNKLCEILDCLWIYEIYVDLLIAE